MTTDGLQIPQERLDALADVLLDHDERIAREAREAAQQEPA